MNRTGDVGFTLPEFFLLSLDCFATAARRSPASWRGCFLLSLDCFAHFPRPSARAKRRFLLSLDCFSVPRHTGQVRRQKRLFLLSLDCFGEVAAFLHAVAAHRLSTIS